MHTLEKLKKTVKRMHTEFEFRRKNARLNMDGSQWI